MTSIEIDRPNGRGLEPVPAVTLRKLTDPSPSSDGASGYKVPKANVAWSLATGNPIPRHWLPQVLALVAEQDRIGVRRDPGTLSNMEALETSKGMAGAEAARDRGADELGVLVDQAAVLAAERSTIHAELDRLDELPVAGMDGESTTVGAARERMAALSATVVKEREAGAVKHRRVSRVMGLAAKAALVVDFPVFLHFTTQVFNVDVAGLASGDGVAWSTSVVPLLTSVIFALLGTVAVALGLGFFGRELKGYKDARAHLVIPDAPAHTIPLLFVGLSLALGVGASVVMAYRIVSESLSAGGGLTSAVVLGAFFAIVVLTVNAVVFFVHFRDGWLQTDEIAHLAGQVAPIEQRRIELLRRLDPIAPQLDQLRLKATRVHARTLARIGEPIKGADQLRLLARSYHQGCGAEATLRTSPDLHTNLIEPTIAVDHSILDTLLSQLEDLIDPDEPLDVEGTAPKAERPPHPVMVPEIVTESDEFDGEW